MPSRRKSPSCCSRAISRRRQRGSPAPIARAFSTNSGSWRRRRGKLESFRSPSFLNFPSWPRASCCRRCGATGWSFSAAPAAWESWAPTGRTAAASTCLPWKTLERGQSKKGYREATSRSTTRWTSAISSTCRRPALFCLHLLARRLALLAADYSLPLITLLFLPLYAIHRGGRAAIAKEHQAVHDALTGLPNRVLFRDRVEQAIRTARRHGTGFTVMLMDLNHFKEINDTLGHHQGDRLLQEVAERLRVTLRESDTVARLGGDEFGIVLNGAGARADAAAIAEGVLARLREPFRVDATTLQVGGSIGLATFPEHGEDVETLIQRADIAMYAAKSSSGEYACFDASQDHHSPRRLAIAAELRGAIERRELVLAYQPKADLRTGRIVGVEALARWEHPELGLVHPGEFVPIAEQTGLIIALTSAVLDAALERAAAWRALGHDLTVAVNLSARSFLDAGLGEEIPRLLAARDVPPDRLELEITESMLMQDPHRARATLERLAAIGVGLAVDDFGTGYSSLAQLKRLPVDTIKIDKSFVLDMAHDEADDAIVRSTIELAHNLGLQAVAEGVESAAIWMRLVALGCDLAQGFHLAPPLHADALLAFLDAERGVPTAA